MSEKDNKEYGYVDDTADERDDTAEETPEEMPEEEYAPDETEEEKEISDDAAPVRKVSARSVLMCVLTAVLCLAIGFTVGYCFTDAPKLRNELSQAQRTIEDLKAGRTEGELDHDEAFAIMTGEEEAMTPETIDLMGEETKEEEYFELTGDAAAETGNEEAVAAEFEGGKILASTVLAKYQEIYAYSTFLGYDTSDTGAMLNDAMMMVLKKEVSRIQAEKMGLTVYDEADEREIARLAEETGNNAESVRSEYWMTKLYASFESKVTITDKMLSDRYDELVRQQEDDFTTDHGHYEQALNAGSTIWFDPVASRKIAYVYIPFTSEDQQLAAGYVEAGDETSLEELYIRYETGILPLTEEGAGKEKMKELFPETREVFITESSDCVSYDFVTECLKLDVSDQIRVLHTPDGVACVICLEANEQGIREMTDGSKNEIRSILLSEEANEMMNRQIDQWVEEAKPIYHPENLI